MLDKARERHEDATNKLHVVNIKNNVTLKAAIAEEAEAYVTLVEAEALDEVAKVLERLRAKLVTARIYVTSLPRTTDTETYKAAHTAVCLAQDEFVKYLTCH